MLVIEMQRQTQVQETAELGVAIDYLEKAIKALMLVESREIYPPESKFKKSFIKRSEKLLKQLKEGKLKMHTYKSFADFDKSIG